ncbi:MAG: DNA replication complex GINS protein PSF1, partial [Amphiamblys sp. WSBS2006]
RCLVAYHQNRMRRLKEKAHRQETLVAVCSKKENAFLQRHIANIKKYEKTFPVQLKLIGEQTPPKSLYVKIAALQDCGAVLTEDGPILLLKNTTHLVKRTDVEELIREGVVKEF